MVIFKKLLSFLLISALISIIPPASQVRADDETLNYYRHAFECIQLLNGETYETESAGNVRKYTYKTTDEIFQPKTDDFSVYNNRIMRFMHMILTGCPADIEAYYDSGGGYPVSVFYLEMRVYMPMERTREARDMARRIVAETINDNMNSREKYFALYKWMAENVRYDTKAIGPDSVESRAATSEGQSFENALLNRLAVCAGIGRAYMVLCQAAGLPALFITGDTLSDHAWNKIYLDGKWLNVDITDACEWNNLNAGYFAVEDRELSGDRYLSQLSDYLEIVPFLYPNLEQMTQEPPPAPSTAFDANEIKVMIDGKPVIFDVPPQIINDRVMVPLRAIFEEMGAAVIWDADVQTVTAGKSDVIVTLTIGDSFPTVNGETRTIDQPGIIVDDRTLAPLRFVAEAFGGVVDWDGASQTAKISKN